MYSNKQIEILKLYFLNCDDIEVIVHFVSWAIIESGRKI